MGDGPSVVILDQENELARIQKLVTRLGVDCVRWRGESDEPPQPRTLLVTTGAQALKMSAPKAAAGKRATLVWLCVHTEDFFPLRDRLRERGVHYLVQLTTGDEALRLLLQQILYRGTDRRGASRLPMDCQVEVKLRGRKPIRAKLLELSTDGCRFECGRVLESGTKLAIKIPNSLGGVELELPGRVIRSESPHGANDRVVMHLEGISSEAREQIEAIIRGDRIGTRVTPLAAIPEREPDAYVDGTGIPDWDELATAGERRRHPRRPVAQLVETVRAQEASESHSVMGVDLSVDGMRVVGLPAVEIGAEVRVALHSNVGAEPISLEAVVLRDDGDSVALQFRSVTPELCEQIEALMDEKPSVEALQSSGTDRIVMSEVTAFDGSAAG